MALSLFSRVRVYLIATLALLLFGAFAAGSVYAAVGIQGTVFRDFNGNGIKDAGDVGLGGIGVAVFDSTGAAQGTATSTANGTYTTTPNLGTPPYRVEFTIPASPDPLSVYKPAASGTDNDTSVQFVASGTATGVDFGVNYPGDFCQNNPNLCSTSYVNGNLASAGALTELYQWPYNSTGTSPAPTGIATADEIGSTWGLALARTSKTLYISAVVKRHVDIGPGGGVTPNPYGTIYKRDLVTGTNTYFATIPVAATGSVTRNTTCPNDPNALCATTTASHDSDAYAKVGKTGLGGITISDDESTLYVTSLGDGNIYAIPISTGIPAILGGGASSGPTVTCTNGVYRPWALKFWRGKLYAGGVCDASTGAKADLKAVVSAYDFTTNTWSANLLSNPSLDMSATNGGTNKGEVVNCTSGAYDYGYYPWSDNGSSADLAGANYYCRDSGADGPPGNINAHPKIEVHPMPILSDLEFDVDGSMMLGITDRFGNMIGWRNWGLDTDTQLYDVIVGGDTLRACPAVTPGIWDLESNGSCGGVTTGGANNHQGLHDGEWYYGDTTKPDGSQKEDNEGGLAFVPGKGRIVSTAQDPDQVTIAQGVIFENNANPNAGQNPLAGGNPAGYQLYVNGDANTFDSHFGKANGLGDLIALCNVAPVEIGNRVWDDANNNGIQDAGEVTINGADVELWVDTDNNGSVDTQIATARTDANGNYYFSNDPRGYPAGGNNNPNAVTGLANGGFVDDSQGGRTSTVSAKYGLLGLKPGQNFEVRLDTTAGPNAPLLTGLTLTTQNANSNTNDNIDSDASMVGSVATIAASTSGPGANDHTFDIGFAPPTTLLLGTIGNRVWLDEDSNGYQDKGEDGIPNVTVQLKDSGGTVIATQSTDANGGYLFTGLPAGTYSVKVLGSTIPAGMSQTTTYPNAGADFYNQDQSGTGYPITLGSGENNLTADFGYNWNPTNAVDTGGAANTVAALGDRLWIDSNGNGRQDEGEAGVQGAVVELFGSPGPDGIWGNGDDVPYTAGGYTPQRTTDANGNYMFDNLPPGQYETRVVDTSTANYDVNGGQYTQTGDPDHYGTTGTVNDNQTTIPVILGPGDVFLNADYGYQPGGAGGTPQLGSIGNFVWYDRDADGVGPTVGGEAHGAAPGNDNTEFGIGGVTVSLIRDLNGNGIWDSGEPIIATTHTSDGTEDVDHDGSVDYRGYYNFRDLTTTDGAGTDDYLVWVNDTKNVLNGLRPTYDQNGPAPATGLATGLGISSVADLTTTPVINQDFGYTDMQVLDTPTNSGVLGDRVWLDKNSDGVQDTGEPGIPGVTIKLYDSTGTTLLATTTTGSDGLYLFSNLPTSAGGITYVVRVDTTTLPGGLSETFDNSGSQSDSESQTTLTDAAPIDLNQDFGYVGSGTIGNFVWLDTNADGIVNGPDSGQGIGGVTIDLYYDKNGNGKIDVGEIKLDTTTTAPDGSYLFTHLPVDDGGGNAQYVVNVTDTAGVLQGTWHSIGAQAQSSNNTSKFSPYAATLTPGAPNMLTADFGYYLIPGAVGNYVWYDTNGDGKQDGTEVGVNGATVTLTIRYPGADNALNTADDTVTVLTTQTITEPGGTRDGYYTFGNLLQDEDYNGLGTYSTEPSHTLTVTLPTGYTSSPVSAGGTTALNDSNNPAGTLAQPLKGDTDTSFSNDSDSISSYDFGIFRLRLTGTVWLDINNGAYNGVLDNASETPNGGAESGLTVYLYADNNNDNVPDGAALQTTTTGATGNYVFEGLAPGRYIVSVVQPAGWRSTIDNYDAADTANPQLGTDNNDNGIGGVTGQIFSHSFDLEPGDTGSSNNVNNNTATTRNDRLDFGMNQSPTAAELASVTAQSPDATSVVVSWQTLNERLVSGFNVQRSDTQNGAFVNVNTDFISAKTPGSDLGNSYDLTDTSGTNGATYWYRVEVNHSDSTLDYSDPIQVTVGATTCAGKTLPATLLSPTDNAQVQAAKVKFKWAAVTCATTYKFQLRLGSHKGQVIVNKKGLTKPQLTRKNLHAGTVYVWRVLACNANGQCTASAWQTFKTKKQN